MRKTDIMSVFMHAEKEHGVMKTQIYTCVKCESKTTYSESSRNTNVVGGQITVLNGQL